MVDDVLSVKTANQASAALESLSHESCKESRQNRRHWLIFSHQEVSEKLGPPLPDRPHYINLIVIDVIGYSYIQKRIVNLLKQVREKR